MRINNIATCVVVAAATIPFRLGAGTKAIPDTLRLMEVEVTETYKAPVTLLPLDVTVVTEERIEKSAQKIGRAHV